MESDLHDFRIEIYTLIRKIEACRIPQGKKETQALEMFQKLMADKLGDAIIEIQREHDILFSDYSTLF